MRLNSVASRAISSLPAITSREVRSRPLPTATACSVTRASGCSTTRFSTTSSSNNTAMAATTRYPDATSTAVRPRAVISRGTSTRKVSTGIPYTSRNVPNTRVRFSVSVSISDVPPWARGAIETDACACPPIRFSTSGVSSRPTMIMPRERPPPLPFKIGAPAIIITPRSVRMNPVAERPSLRFARHGKSAGRDRSLVQSRLIGCPVSMSRAVASTLLPALSTIIIELIFNCFIATGVMLAATKAGLRSVMYW